MVAAGREAPGQALQSDRLLRLSTVLSWGEKALEGKEADRDWLFLRNSVIHLLINNRHSQNVYQLQGGGSRTFTKPPLCPQGQPAADSHCFRMKPWRYIASRKTKSL